MTDDEKEAKMLSLSRNAFLVLFDLSNKMRAILKYEELDGKTYDVLEKLSDYFYDELQENGINLENMWS
jgi:hypothetical protein